MLGPWVVVLESVCNVNAQHSKPQTRAQWHPAWLCGRASWSPWMCWELEELQPLADHGRAKLARNPERATQTTSAFRCHMQMDCKVNVSESKTGRRNVLLVKYHFQEKLLLK